MSIPPSLKAFALVCWLTVASLAAGNPFVGVWKMNAAKSKFSRGAPTASSAVVRIEPAGAGLKYTIEGADGNGNPFNYSTSGTLDGKPGRVVGSSVVDSIAATRVDDYTIKATAKRGAQALYTDTRTVSKDGKTLTIVRAGTTPDGVKYQSTFILEKQ